ncbi:MAG: thiamine-phosphate kinase [Flavobacteriales bacterium]|nr:thiamine-phosphate kinase [Flavobacteriales bacterium]
MEKENRTELSELGEFGLIKHLTDQILLQNKSSVKGIGDDAAILRAPEGQSIVVSTDLLVEGIHFDLSYVPLQHLGYKSVVVNLSDICAMNAIPQQITVSIAVSNRFSLEAIETLYSGIYRACEFYGVDLVGGDTSSSKSGLMISVTAIGYAPEEKIATRSGARESELLVVSGDLGGAYLGLQVLEREKKVFLETKGVQPELTGYDYVLERQLKPEARKDIVELLAALDVKPTSMIDVSDGLASEILHLAEQSDVGFDLYEEKIPMSPRTAETADEFNIIRTTCALNGGEDYELLFTIRQSDFDKIKGNPNLTVIGHATHSASGCRLITLNGEPIVLRAQGWDSMK